MSYCIVSYCIMACRTVLCRIISHCIVLRHVVLHRIVSYRIMLYHISQVSFLFKTDIDIDSVSVFQAGLARSRLTCSINLIDNVDIFS